MWLYSLQTVSDLGWSHVPEPDRLASGGWRIQGEGGGNTVAGTSKWTLRVSLPLTPEAPNLKDHRQEKLRAWRLTYLRQLTCRTRWSRSNYREKQSLFRHIMKKYLIWRHKKRMDKQPCITESGFYSTHKQRNIRNQHIPTKNYKEITEFFFLKETLLSLESAAHL